MDADDDDDNVAVFVAVVVAVAVCDAFIVADAVDADDPLVDAVDEGADAVAKRTTLSR